MAMPNPDWTKGSYPCKYLNLQSRMMTTLVFKSVL